jgi:DNA repair exonuclease SbcCD ATPase subunit
LSNPLILKYIELRNLLSFGNATITIDLTTLGSTLIVGENLDTMGANGCGKSAIINAICYALYNKPFDSISLNNLVNKTNGLKGTLMEVRIFFSKGDDEYEVYRCRGETFNIQVLKNGEDITLDSVTGNDALVQEIIGMSYDLFTKVIIFSGNSMPFLMVPVSQQRQQIEELFNITILTEKAIKLKERIKQTEGSISVQEAIIREREAAVTLYNKHVKDAKSRIERWETDRSNQLELMEAVNMDEEKELHSLVSMLKDQEASIEKKLSVAKKDKTAIAQEVKKLVAELEHLEDAKCPYCLQEYAGAMVKLEEKRALLEEKIIQQEEFEGIVKTLSDEAAEIIEQRKNAKSLMKFASLSEAIKAEAIASTASQKIQENLSALNPHEEAYEQLVLNPVTSIDYTDLNELKKVLDHQQFLLKLLTDKNSFIRRKIIQKTIPFLNNRLVHYTKELGLPHVVRFDDDMSCCVAEYGRELDFGNLSSGEKKRVNLSMSLAFRDVLHHLHSRVNLMFIDEIDASLDASGVENVFKLLKDKTRDEGLGLWIISHRPEAVGRFDRTVTIRKQNGFSRIIVNGEIDEIS